MLFNWFRGSLAFLMDRCIDNNLIHILQCRSGGHWGIRQHRKEPNCKYWIECSLAEIAERLNHLTLRTRWRRKQESDKERDVLRDLPRDEPNTRSISTNSYRHHVYIDNGIYGRRSTKDLIHSYPICRRVSYYDDIPFFDKKFSKTRFIILLSNLNAYFYLNRVPCYQKVRFAIHKLTCGAKKWWVEVLESRAHIVKCLILSWQAWENY